MKHRLSGAALLTLGMGCAASTTQHPQAAHVLERVTSVASESPPGITAPAQAAPPSACALAADVDPVHAPELEDVEGVSTNNVRAWVAALAAPELRGREAGTRDSRRAARLIAEYLARLGVRPAPGSDYCRAFARDGVRDQNVVGHLDAGAAPWVVLGAHYDALGVDTNGQILPGADDNATGVAVLLEVARQLTRDRQAGLPERRVAFVAFGAEEAGLFGSEAYVAEPSIPLAQTQLMINIDMAGRLLGGNPGIGYEASGARRAQSTTWVREAAAIAKVGVAPMHLGDRSDSASFALHVPSVFFSTTIHADYHRATDTAERVDYAQVTRAARLVLALVKRASR